jgi:hypothetical protein
MRSLRGPPESRSRQGSGLAAKGQVMSVSQAVSAATDLPTVEAKVRAFVAVAISSSADGLTISEMGELTVALLRLVIAALDSIPADGAEKKAFAIAAVGQLFDAVADYCVPMLAQPIWYIVRPAVRQLVLLAASGMIEQLLPLVRMSSR